MSLANSDGKIACNGGGAGSPFGSDKHKQLASYFFGGTGDWPADRSANHRFRYGAGSKRLRKILASAGTHAAHKHLRVGIRGVHDHRCRTIAADIFNQVQSVFGVAVEIHDDNVVIFLQQFGQIIQFRIARYSRVTLACGPVRAFAIAFGVVLPDQSTQRRGRWFLGHRGLESW